MVNAYDEEENNADINHHLNNYYCVLRTPANVLCEEVRLLSKNNDHK